MEKMRNNEILKKYFGTDRSVLTSMRQLGITGGRRNEYFHEFISVGAEYTMRAMERVDIDTERVEGLVRTAIKRAIKDVLKSNIRRTNNEQKYADLAFEVVGYLNEENEKVSEVICTQEDWKTYGEGSEESVFIELCENHLSTEDVELLEQGFNGLGLGLATHRERDAFRKRLARALPNVERDAEVYASNVGLSVQDAFLTGDSSTNNCRSASVNFLAEADALASFEVDSDGYYVEKKKQL